MGGFPYYGSGALISGSRIELRVQGVHWVKLREALKGTLSEGGEECRRGRWWRELDVKERRQCDGGRGGRKWQLNLGSVGAFDQGAGETQLRRKPGRRSKPWAIRRIGESVNQQFRHAALRCFCRLNALQGQVSKKGGMRALVTAQHCWGKAVLKEGFWCRV